MGSSNVFNELGSCVDPIMELEHRLAIHMNAVMIMQGPEVVRYCTILISY